jgi:hypothetical protein
LRLYTLLGNSLGHKFTDPITQVLIDGFNLLHHALLIDPMVLSGILRLDVNTTTAAGPSKIGSTHHPPFPETGRVTMFGGDFRQLTVQSLPFTFFPPPAFFNCLMNTRSFALFDPQIYIQKQFVSRNSGAT